MPAALFDAASALLPEKMPAAQEKIRHSTSIHETFWNLFLFFLFITSPFFCLPVFVQTAVGILGFLQPLKLYSVLLYNRRKYNVYPFLPEMHEKLPCPHLSGTDMGVSLSPADADATDFPQLLCFYRLISILFFSFNRDTARARDAFDIRYS